MVVGVTDFPAGMQDISKLYFNIGPKLFSARTISRIIGRIVDSLTEDSMMFDFVARVYLSGN